MSNAWFRFYSAAMRNPKVAALSDRDFRLWVSMLSAASENEGKLPPATELKHMLNARLDHLLAGVDRLISAGLIDALEHGYTPHHWEKFQYKSDSSTERVRRHRAERNVAETAPEQNRTEQKIEPRAQQIEPVPREPQLLDRLFEAAGIAGFREERHPGLLKIGPMRALIDQGYDLDRDILPVIRERSRNVTFNSWSYFVGAIIDAAKLRSSIPPKQEPPAEDWGKRLAVWQQSRTWAQAWGPKPGEIGCKVPPELMKAA